MKCVPSAGLPPDEFFLFTDALIIPLILYCFRVIFPALQKEDLFVLFQNLFSYLTSKQ